MELPVTISSEGTMPRHLNILMFSLNFNEKVFWCGMFICSNPRMELPKLLEVVCMVSGGACNSAQRLIVDKRLFT